MGGLNAIIHVAPSVVNRCSLAVGDFLFNWASARKGDMPTQQPSLFDLNQIKALNPDKDVIYIPPTTDMIKVYTEAVVHSLNRKTIPSDDFEDVFEREFRNFVTVITRIHAKHLSKGESYEKQKGTTRSDTA